MNCGRAREGGWYEHPVMGWNYRLTEWQGALLLAQMERAEEQIARRSDNVTYLNSLLEQIEGIEPVRICGDDDSVSAYHLHMLRYNAEAFGGLDKHEFIAAVSAEGIPISAGYSPLYRNEMFQRLASGCSCAERFTGLKLDYDNVFCPVCEKVSDSVGVWMYQSIFLGTHSDMDDVAEAFAKVQKNAHELQTQP